MAIRDNLSGVNRTVAWALAFVWLGAGIAGIVFGVGRAQVALAVAGVLAIVYGLLWLRVAARSRLLSWRELIAPWRA